MARCLVTVGTTKFDGLIRALDLGADRLVEILHRNGIRRLLLQVGNGTHPLTALPDAARRRGLELEVLQFHPQLDRLIQESDLVISHAGVRGCCSFCPGALLRFS
jgi:UDP-N-acetylglucosamine transferase subunit ALG13